MLDGVVDVLALGLGEEPDVAEVDPEQRRAAAPGHLGAAQDRAVTAEHADQLAPLGGGVPVVDQGHARVLGQVDGGGLVALDDHLDAGRVQPFDHGGGDVVGLLAARVGHEQDPATRRGAACGRCYLSSWCSPHGRASFWSRLWSLACGHGAVTSSAALTRASHPIDCASRGVSHNRYSALPSPPSIGLRASGSRVQAGGHAPPGPPR